MRFPLALVFVAALGVATTARAQSPPPVSSRSSVVEFGAGLGEATVPQRGIFLPGLRISYNVADNLGLKLSVDSLVGSPVDGHPGVYGIQAQYFWGRPPDVRRAFVTFGAAGSYWFQHVDTRRSTLPTTGDVITYPAHFDAYLQKPEQLLIGGGLRFRTRSRMLVDISGQVLTDSECGLILIVQAALVVPIGQRR